MNCYLCNIGKNTKENKSKYLCKNCKSTLKNNFLLFDESNIYYKLIEKQEALDLIYKKIIKPRSKDSLIKTDKSFHLNNLDKEINYVFLLENGIKEITRREADSLVDNKLARRINDFSIKMLFKRKDLINNLLKSENKTCKICKIKTDCTSFLEEFSDFSIVTEFNAFCACPRCRTEYSEKNYFKWLNIELEEDAEINVELFNYSKTKRFLIDEKTSERLINEKMAIRKDNYTQVLFDRTGFRIHIKNKSKNKCFYCNQKGSTIDHIFPQSKGGLTTPENCIWSCGPCNEKKANLSQEEFKGK